VTTNTCSRQECIHDFIFISLTATARSFDFYCMAKAGDAAQKLGEEPPSYRTVHRLINRIQPSDDVGTSPSDLDKISHIAAH
jgi:hypothetical protein